MPFLEFLGQLLLIVLGIAVFIVMLGFAGSVAYINFYIGWLPILMCLSDADWDISFNGNIIEIWAAFSLTEYGILLAVILALAGLEAWLSRSSKPRSAEPTWLDKIFYWVYDRLLPHPVRKLVANPKRRQGTKLDTKAIIETQKESLQTMPSTTVSKHRARQAKAMAAELNAEAEMLDAVVKRERAQAAADAHTKENTPSPRG